MNKVVHEFDSYVLINVPSREIIAALKALTNHWIGEDVMVNLVNPNTNMLVPNPIVENHPNKEQHREAHYRVQTSQGCKIRVSVWEDGSLTFVPTK